jgi:hypothetical protein
MAVYKACQNFVKRRVVGIFVELPKEILKTVFGTSRRFGSLCTLVLCLDRRGVMIPKGDR